MELFKITLVLIFSLIVFAYSIITETGLNVKYKITSFKKCVKSDHVLNTLIQVSLSQCVEECAFRLDCRAVNYFRLYNLCELFPDDIGESFESTKARTCVFVKKDDMDMSEVNEKCVSCGPRELCDREADYACAVKGCESFTIRNGRVNGNMRSVGTSITFECDPMYIAAFEKFGATCLANGSWTYQPACEKDADGNNICSGCIPPRDCQDIQVLNETAETGAYDVYPTGSDGFKVRCDMDTPPGGWTVFQRRESDSDFRKDWQTYKEGFGNLGDNFWLGNDKIWKLTSNDQYRLRVDLKDEYGIEGYAEYNSFSIGDESTNYILNIGGHNGTATDSLIGRHNGMMFSTFDRDHDTYPSNCAFYFKGGWWYCYCQSSNLNGPYGNVLKNQGMTWKYWRDEDEFMRFTEMKIRRK